MKKIYFKTQAVLFAVVASLSFSLSSQALELNNVAFNKPVTLNGPGVFGTGAPAPTVVDNQFLTDSTDWNYGTVWWQIPWFDTTSAQSIQIDLQGIFDISKATIQADSSDSYILLYRVVGTNNWLTAWDIPKNNTLWGMQTNSYTFDNIITTDALRFTHNSGNGEYSVSEIQAFGTPTPEPSSMVLGIMGIGSMLGFRRKKSV